MTNAAPNAPVARKTIAKQITFAGVGLHSGAKIRVYIDPAESGGLRFADTSLPDEPPVPVGPDSVADSTRNTTLGRGRVRFQTVEHLLAPLWVNGITDALIRINGAEPPALDGSAREYADVIGIAGSRELEAMIEPLALESPVMVKLGHDRAWAAPHPGLRVTYVLDYEHPMVGASVFDIELTPQSFRTQIAPARTFALESEVTALFASGLAKGGSLDNALVVYDDRYSAPLRFPDEFARHKALDLIGDLALLGRPLRAHVVSVRGGHRLNAELVRALRQRA